GAGGEGGPQPRGRAGPDRVQQGGGVPGRAGARGAVRAGPAHGHDRRHVHRCAGVSRSGSGPGGMSRLPQRLAAVLILTAVAGFAYSNAAERVTLRLGLLVIKGVPLALVITGAAVLGMLAVLVAGGRPGLRVRRSLGDRLAREP